RLELVDDVAYRLTLGRRPEMIGVQTIEQLRLRRGDPARPLRPVLLEQRAIGVRLEIARSPCHWCLDDLVADHQDAVARTRGAKAVGGPVWRTEAKGEIDDVRPADFDPLRFDQVDEALGLPLRGLEEDPRVWPTGG